MIKLTTLAVLCTFTAHSATVGTLFLKGTVPSILSIEVTPEPLASALPIHQSQSNVKVATVTSRSNSSGGYTVNIQSTNFGYLKRNNGTEALQYTMTYAGTAVNLGNGQDFTHSFTNAAPVDRDVKISYTGTEALPAGDYTDTVTFTITGN